MTPTVERVYGLDLLRGACAVLVVAYHMLVWTGHREMYTWGLHGVYIFFVLSGASLTLAYKHRFDTGFPFSSFLRLRAARLGPLFAIATLIMLSHKWVSEGHPLEALAAGVLSTSLLFGFGNPGSSSLVAGGWSIGVEVVFYLIFPALLAFAYSRRWLAIAAGLLLVQTAFVMLTLGSHADIRGAAWDAYTQPLAFMAYFFFGCLIGRYVISQEPLSPWFARIALMTVMAAVISLSGPTAVATVTGWRGAALFALAVAATFFAAFIAPASASFIKLCETAGNMSYGLYLLHPIVFLVLKRALPSLSLPAVFLATLLPSITVALLLERYFERPVRGLLRRHVFSPSPA